MNGTTKVPAERSGLIPLLYRSPSDTAGFKPPPEATASVKVTDSSDSRSYTCTMVSLKQDRRD